MRVQVGGNVQIQVQIARDDANLHRSGIEQLLHDVMIRLRQAFMDVRNALRECFLQRFIRHAIQ